ncbi:hypothetical protein, partial [Methylobacterium aquaticum]|uniref:hypothetical protein n=1 Tax=Methylobacterium aquaticum TaxID=270351 RepID=UPI0018CDAF2B
FVVSPDNQHPVRVAGGVGSLVVDANDDPVGITGNGAGREWLPLDGAEDMAAAVANDLSHGRAVLYELDW